MLVNEILAEIHIDVALDLNVEGHQIMYQFLVMLVMLYN